jgi:Do/DeqQ family serine protease
LGAGLATVGTGAIQANQPNLAFLPGLTAPDDATPDSGSEIAPSTLTPPSTSSFVAQIVQQAGPAVVRIDASHTVTTRLPEAFQSPFFREFFGDLPESEERVEQGVGSGFIVSAEGTIFTNAHVVEGADTVQVTLKDGRILDGRVVGTDPLTDVAVIDIEANNLPTVPLSNSDNLLPGEWAIAIGNPLGLDSTVTVGIVSATGRSSGQVGVSDKRVDFIQTDAAINPGNSGGPLFNERGEVIGMNTAIIRNAQGIGFAIPINAVNRIADQLLATGRVEHPYLGIRMVALTPQIKESINERSNLNVQEEEGILIVEVMDNSPATQAGLRPGDVIVSVGGQPIESAAEVQQRVEAVGVGNELQLQIRRGGRDQAIAIRPEAMPTR